MAKKDRVNTLLDKAPGWIKSLFDHNRYFAVAALVICGLFVFNGCMLKARSPFTGKTVSEPEFLGQVAEETARLEAQARILDAKVKAGEAQFEAQRQVLRQVYAILGGFVGKIPGLSTIPGGEEMLLSVLSLGFAGVTADNIRKGSIIRKSKGQA